jgi:hypothetical protein
VTFPDALAGAALAGSRGAPLYVATGSCIPASTSLSLTRMGVSTIVLLGSSATLNSSVASFQRC